MQLENSILEGFQTVLIISEGQMQNTLMNQYEVCENMYLDQCQVGSE